jgi:hypothetical protein
MQIQIVLRYPTVTCPGCKRPMTPSPPLPVSDDTDLCDVTYTCKNCGATTTRTSKSRSKIGSALICGELSNGSAALPLYPFWPGYIINMSGYDFRKGQVSPHRTRLI